MRVAAASSQQSVGSIGMRVAAASSQQSAGTIDMRVAAGGPAKTLHVSGMRLRLLASSRQLPVASGFVVYCLLLIVIATANYERALSLLSLVLVVVHFSLV
jgi:hypothetical protein